MYSPSTSHVARSPGTARVGTFGARGAFPTVPGPFGAGGRAVLADAVGAAARKVFPGLIFYGALLILANELGDDTVGEPPTEYPHIPNGLTYKGNVRHVNCDASWAALKWSGYGSAERSSFPLSNTNVLYQELTSGTGAPNGLGYQSIHTGPIKPGRFLLLTNYVYWRPENALPNLTMPWPRDVTGFKNETKKDIVAGPPLVVWGVPLGPPIPQAFEGTGYPLVPTVKPRRKTFPYTAVKTPPRDQVWNPDVPVTDITVDLLTDKVVVHAIPAYPPPPGMREIKGRPASAAQAAAATTAFMLWNVVTDWRDWLRIVAAATPGWSDYSNDPVGFLDALRRNPSLLFDTRWDIVAIEALGWSVDETLGAKLGKVQQKASQGIGGLISSATGASTRAPSFGAGTVGGLLTDIIYNHLYGNKVTVRKRGRVYHTQQGNIRR